MAWFSGWGYRKSITISRSAGAVNNHRKRVVVGESGIGETQVHACEATTGWTTTGGTLATDTGYEGTYCLKMTATQAGTETVCTFSSEDWSDIRYLKVSLKRGAISGLTYLALWDSSGGINTYLLSTTTDWVDITVDLSDPMDSVGLIDFSDIVKFQFGTYTDDLVLYIDDIRTMTALIDCEGNCASDFDDLRFATSDGETLLDYWIESISGTTPNQTADVWVEWDTIGTSATTFYLYYGKGSAEAYSDGEATFPLFDDFDGDAVDTDKWTDNGGTTVAGGILTVAATSAAAYGVKGKVEYGTDYILRSKVKPTHVGNTTYLERICWIALATNDQLSAYFNHVVGGYNNKYTNVLNAGTYTAEAILTATAGVFQTVEITRNSTVAGHYKLNDKGVASITANLFTGNLVPDITAYANGAGIECDWILVRDYLAVPPFWGSFGSEEEATGWMGKICGVTNPSKICGVPTSDVGEV